MIVYFRWQQSEKITRQTLVT